MGRVRVVAQREIETEHRDTVPRKNRQSTWVAVVVPAALDAAEDRASAGAPAAGLGAEVADTFAEKVGDHIVLVAASSDAMGDMRIAVVRVVADREVDLAFAELGLLLVAATSEYTASVSAEVREVA
jgi:hypothetical protein